MAEKQHKENAELEAGKLDPDTVLVEAREMREKSRDLIESVEKNLASVRQTLADIDALDERWKDVQKRFGEALAISLQSAFGVEAPCRLSEEEKSAVLGGRPSIEELCKRLREGQYRKIIAVTGAGISVSAGIPDYRSAKTGLYSDPELKKYNLTKPEEVFDLELFYRDPRPFFSVAKKIYPGKFKPTKAHYFIRLLAEKGLLLRCYTQNIDTLERLAGVPEDCLVEGHGSFARAKCVNPACGKEYNGEEIKTAIFDNRIPKCTGCGGVVKPCVVLFGEELPERFKSLYEGDFTNCDLLVVMGTSLQVQPFSGLIYRVPQTTPRLLINQERVGSFQLASEGGYRDVALLGECDSVVERVCELCGWGQRLAELGTDTPRCH